MESYEFIGSLAVTVMAAAALIWRFETRISDLSDRVSRIEALVEGFFVQAGKKDD